MLNSGENETSGRGRFRSMDMAELRESARQHWPTEPSLGLYACPLPASVAAAGEPLTMGIPAGMVYRRGPFFCAESPESHIGPFSNAIDYLVPDGSPVYAAHSGRIIEVVEHHTTFGDGPEFRDTLNYVTIQHDIGGRQEFSQYCHLAPNSLSDRKLCVGSLVEQGQEIATVWKTGWTDRDHLHFIVFRKDDTNKFGFRSLEVRFADILHGATISREDKLAASPKVGG